MRTGRTEIVAAGLAVLWVATLSLFMFYQGLYFYRPLSWNVNALAAASVLLRTVESLWFASFFSALAFGLAWYAFSHLRITRSANLKKHRTDRLAIAQVYSTLCLGICAFAVNYRLLPFLPMLTSSKHRLSEPLLALDMGTQDMGFFAPALERQAWIGALAAAVVFLQAWHVLPRIGGNRRRLSALSMMLLAVGLVVGWSGILERTPAPAPRAVLDMDSNSPVLRGLLIGDPDYRDETDHLLESYLFTHSDQGTVTPLKHLRRGRLPEWPPIGGEGDPGRSFRCELCQLPGVAVWTTSGLPLRLGDVGPVDREPTAVIEVPRGHEVVRFYAPGRAGEMTFVPMEAVTSELRSSDWVVLKIDFAVPMETVTRLLHSLSEQGVRRVDLAVVPFGFNPLPFAIPLLSVGTESEAPVFEPSAAPSPPRDRVVIVRRYVPPPPQMKRERFCRDVDRWMYYDAWAQYASSRPGSLPAHIRLSVTPKMQYGEFAALLQSAMSGAPERISIAPLHELN